MLIAVKLFQRLFFRRETALQSLIIACDRMYNSFKDDFKPLGFVDIMLADPVMLRHFKTGYYLDE